MDALAKAYPACCVSTELLRAAEWVKANPERRKSNWYRFLTNWLNRTQNGNGTARCPPAETYRGDGVLSRAGQATARNMAAILEMERKAK
jgi:hypothetical protein